MLFDDLQALLWEAVINDIMYSTDTAGSVVTALSEIFSLVSYAHLPANLVRHLRPTFLG